MIKEIALDLIEKYGEKGAYEIATWTLHTLCGKRYCLWQTYDQEDIETNLGRKPTDDEFDAMEERLANSFDYISTKEEN